MRCLIARRGLCSIVLALTLVVPICAQQSTETFRWVDFHSPKDQDIVVWVTRALQVDDWTAIREIGVKYDAALVITTHRATPESLPADDTFSIWTVSLTSHVVAPLISGVNLRIANWQRFADDVPEDLTVLYDNCRNCSTATYFTAFYYDIAHHQWAARWINNGQGVPVWNVAPPSSFTWTQVYAVMTEGGHAQLCTWNHFDYGKGKDSQDVVYRYDRDPMTSLDRTSVLSGKMATDIELKMCSGQYNVQELERGQDSPLCQQLVNPHSERKPVTTPPANNRGRSAVPNTSH